MIALDYRGGFVRLLANNRGIEGFSVFHFFTEGDPGPLRVLGPTFATAPPMPHVMRDWDGPLAPSYEIDRRSARLWAGLCACQECPQCLA